jgi:transcription elongation factor Elf1
MIKAKYIGRTQVRGSWKNRWECPHCRANKEPECRFNLSPDKDNKIHKCRFCGTNLLLKR